MKYQFKAKPVDVETGGKYVILFNHEDAKDLDVKHLDRVRVTTDGGSEVSALVDLTEQFVRKGEAGALSELYKKMNLTRGQTIFVEPVEKPASVGMIRKKMDGAELNADEINTIIMDIMEDNLSDVEATAFISAAYIRGLSHTETIYLAKSIVSSGGTLDLKRRPIMDKHCSGGVPGNRTTMLIVPIIAAAGLTIPKTSSRSITSPAGTADTMEVLAPVTLNEQQITDVVLKCNGCIVWGGGVNLAAADDKLIQIRHPLNLDPRGMLLASILAKKKAVGATHVLVDVPIGKGAKITTREEAEKLAQDFMELGTRLGMEIHCILTPGYDPVGFAVGPALEAREIIRILNGEKVSLDLVEKSLVMAGILLEKGGKAKEGEGKEVARKILESGEAVKKMRQIIELQGGNPNVKPSDIVIGSKTLDINAAEGGRIHYINVQSISAIARAAGAPKDPGAGLYLYVEKGDKIEKGQKLLTIYAESDRKLDVAKEVVEKMPPIELEQVILGAYSTETKPKMYEFG
jgi:AMP phosphorylase